MRFDYVIVYKPFTNEFENMVLSTCRTQRPKNNYEKAGYLLFNSAVIVVRFLLKSQWV
jgi:hypothetical protein